MDVSNEVARGFDVVDDGSAWHSQADETVSKEKRERRREEKREDRSEKNRKQSDQPVGSNHKAYGGKGEDR